MGSRYSRGEPTGPGANDKDVAGVLRDAGIDAFHPRGEMFDASWPCEGPCRFGSSCPSSGLYVNLGWDGPCAEGITCGTARIFACRHLSFQHDEFVRQCLNYLAPEINVFLRRVASRTGNFRALATPGPGALSVPVVANGDGPEYG